MAREDSNIIVRRVSGSTAVTWGIVLLCMVPAAAYYAILICSNYGAIEPGFQPSAPGLFTPVHYGRVFNSMLLHLLQGSFDVDPEAIGREGFVRDGLTYSYFGIALALLRLPFLFM